MPDIPVDPTAVELLVLDVDGVLTGGQIILDHRGRELKVFNVRDGAGLRIWMALGYEVAIITGRSSLALRYRVDELGVRMLRQGVRDKGATLETVRRQLGLDPEQVAVIGDDLPDLAMLLRCGYPIAVADAVEEVRAAAVHVTALDGGGGAVREAVEHLLKARGRWHDALRAFGA